MKSIRSELSLFEFTVASRAWKRARIDAVRLGPMLGLRVVGGTGWLMSRLCAGMVPVLFGGPLPDGPVERMKSAKSCIDSRGTRASLACGPEPERPWFVMDTGGARGTGPPGLAFACASGGCEWSPVVFVTERDLFKDEDLERSRVRVPGPLSPRAGACLLVRDVAKTAGDLLTSISRMFSGVSVYCSVWSFCRSSSKFRATSCARLAPLSSMLGTALNRVEEVDEGDSLAAGRARLGDSGEPRAAADGRSAGFSIV